MYFFQLERRVRVLLSDIVPLGLAAAQQPSAPSPSNVCSLFGAALLF